MNAQEHRSRPVDKSKSATYLKKATEFHRGMLSAHSAGDRNLACLNAIHCAISCTDAVCAFYLNKRPASQNHQDAAVLLAQAPVPGARDKAKQFRENVRFKTLVEYSDDEPTQAEAERLILQASRVYEWAKQMLSK